MKKTSILISVIVFVIITIPLTTKTQPIKNLTNFIQSIQSIFSGPKISLSVSLLPDTGAYGSLTIISDVVDSNGNYLRDLTNLESSQVALDIERTSGLSGFPNEPVSQILLPAHIGTYTNLPASNGTIYAKYVIAVTVSPSGLKYSSMINGPTINLQPNINNVVSIHFMVANDGVIKSSTPPITSTSTPTPTSVSGISTDNKIVSFNFSPYSLSYVKTLVKTYTDDMLNNSNPSFLDGDMGFGAARAFPFSLSEASFSGKPYLFISSLGFIEIYDISDPANPIQVGNFALSSLISVDDFCKPANHGGTGGNFVSAFSISVADDYPYAIIDQHFGDFMTTARGFAILNVNVSGSKVTLSASANQTYCQAFRSADVAQSGQLFKVADGNVYIAGPLPYKMIAGGNYKMGTIGIYNISSSGNVSVASKLYVPFVKTGFESLDFSKMVIIQQPSKTFILSPRTTNSGIWGVVDVSNPSNPVLGSSTYPLLNPVYDKTSELIYSLNGNNLSVYDASSLPSLTLKKTLSLNNIIDIKNTYIKNLRSLLNIPSNQAVTITPTNQKLLTAEGNIIVVSVNTFPDQEIALKQYGYRSELGLSEYVLDLNDLNAPKLAGIITARQSLPADYAGGFGGEDYWYGDALVTNNYIFRADVRRADVWKLNNATTTNQVPANVTSVNGGNNNVTGKIISTTTLKNFQQTLFSFQNILNIFKNILNGK